MIPGETRAAGRRLLRFLPDLAVVVAFVPAMIRALSSGWRPFQDDGAISLRAWEALTLHGPSVGQFSQLSAVGHTPAYDLGPLQYWLLAIPVHLDPVHGALWGATLWCVVAGIVAVEAVRAAGGGLAPFVAGLVVVLSATFMPQEATNPTWNPHFGDELFLASIACCLAVSLGRSRWWPLAVVTGSVAVQAHDMYFGVVPLVLLSAGLGVRRLTHLVAGLLAGVACWIVPLLQEVSGHPGNLSVLLSRSGGGHLGVQTGLRALGASLVPIPRPLWTRSSQPSSLLGVLHGVPSVLGVAVVVATAGVLLLAVRRGDRRLSVLTGSALVLQVWTVAAFALVPADRQSHLWELLPLTVPVGWLTYVVLAMAVVRALPARAHDAAHRAPCLSRDAWAVTGLTALLITVSVVAQVLQQQAWSSNTRSNAQLVSEADRAVSLVELRVRPQPVRLVFKDTRASTPQQERSGEYSVAMQLAALLEPDGYPLTYVPLTEGQPIYPELEAHATQRMLTVLVVLRPAGVSVREECANARRAVGQTGCMRGGMAVRAGAGVAARAAR